MKVAIVTGTSSGIGLHTTIELAKQRYKVIALMRLTSNPAELDEQLKALHLEDQVEQIKLNMDNVHEVAHTIEYINNKHKRIDVLINNVGFAQGGLIELLDYEAWEEQFKVNVWITINLCKAVAPIMRQQRNGKIINLGSISGQLGLPMYGPYAMSKFAIAGFSESLRFELLPFNVYVVLIEAGSYQTTIWKKGFSLLPNNTLKDYERINERMIELTSKSANTTKQPTSLAKFIVRIVQKKKPSLKQVPTWDVKMMIALKTYLHWAWYEYIVNRFFFKFNR